MTRLLRAGLLLALCAGAAACSDTKPAPVAEAPPPPPPPPPAPAANTAVDGLYRGQAVRTAESAKTCRTSHAAIVRVSGGAFSYHAAKGQDFTAVQVGPDGSFSSTAGDTTLKGTIADNVLSGTLDGSTCHYTIKATQRAPKKAASQPSAS